LNRPEANILSFVAMAEMEISLSIVPGGTKQRETREASEGHHHYSNRKVLQE